MDEVLTYRGWMPKHGVVWQLPVNQSSLSNNDWIHPKAKFHAFDIDTRDSACKKHNQDVYLFKTDFDPKEHSATMKCNSCLKKIADTTY